MTVHTSSISMTMILGDLSVSSACKLLQEKRNNDTKIFNIIAFLFLKFQSSHTELYASKHSKLFLQPRTQGLSQKWQEKLQICKIQQCPLIRHRRGIPLRVAALANNVFSSAIWTGARCCHWSVLSLVGVVRKRCVLMPCYIMLIMVNIIHNNYYNVNFIFPWLIRLKASLHLYTDRHE